MMTRLRVVARVGCLIGKILLMAALVTWVAMSPLVWILRDGLAVGMVETTGMEALIKFLVGWGVPALVLAVPLAGLFLIERRLSPRPTHCEEIT